MSDTRTTMGMRGAMTRRTLLGAAAAGGGLLLARGRAFAAGMRAPSGPVEVVVGSSAGGTVDIQMRRMVDVLGREKIVAIPMVVQNRPGGSWSVATNYTLGKRGDENVVMGMAQPVLTTPIVRGAPNVWDKVTPLAMFLQGELVLVVRTNSPYRNLESLVAGAREKPKQVKVAGAQTGSTDHMVTGLIQKAAGVELTYVGFGGGGEAQAAFLGGNVDMVVLNPDEAMPHVESGRARMIAILREQRMAQYPKLKDIPTAREQGYDIVWSQQWGLAGTQDLAPDVVAWWDDVLGKMVKSPTWHGMAAENFLGTDYLDSKGAKAFYARSYQQHLDLLRDLGLAKQ